MAYPMVLFGPDGAQYQTATGTRRTNHPLGGFPYGMQLLVPDGRKYRYCIAGASALVIVLRGSSRLCSLPPMSI